MEKELTAILESEHLEHLAPKFAEQGVTDEILDQLEDSDLRELGVEKLGERKRLLGAFMQNRDIPLSGTVMITVGGGVMPSDSELSGLRVEEFEIGKFPVMQEEWEWVRVWALAKSYELETGYGTGSSHPVTHVSWYDAVKWCNAKSEHELLEPVYYMEGKVYRNGEFGPDGSRLITWHNKARGYRLPTEAEWEWAARGGPLSHGHSFSGSDKAEDVGWYEKNSNGAAKPVGLKSANELGLHDMSGNVWEWCWDMDQSGSAHRIRGGSWNHHADRGTVRYRVSRSPETRYGVIGFRLARNV
ncbi:MAG: SUMF1/EgtB/PvdO family nonheme iron enzyme [Spartobacteria bacterium]